MKKLLFLILLLNFTFVSSLFAQDESDDSLDITNKSMLYLFDNIRNELEKEPNFDKIDTELMQFMQAISIFWSDTNQLDKDLYLINLNFFTDQIEYSFQFINYNNKVLVFDCLFLPAPLINPIRRDSSFMEERQLRCLNQFFKVHLDNGILKLNEQTKSVSYHKAFIENIEEYRKVNPKVIIDHQPKKVANRTDRAVDFLMNTESIYFIFNNYNFSSCEFATAFKYISFLIENNKVIELENILYTVNPRGKLLAAGALLYLQKNEGILLNSEIKERLDYILENEESVTVIRPLLDCGNYDHLWNVYLVKDFEELFEKYGMKSSKKDKNNDVQER
ncbi:hypothetical protein ACE193_22045 [Bernardetia sp. OM2101]|uniref:hypothetical protein n=1 Tax=Bernardetia sp. OM2101 TaxID=3344876 RepID=UPI0035D12D97